jgi:hypothetical protein
MSSSRLPVTVDELPTQHLVDEPEETVLPNPNCFHDRVI